MATQSTEPVKPQIDLNQVKKIVFDLYGLKVAKISELNGYYDRNYHVLVDDNVKENSYIGEVLKDGYVLKIINTLESMDKEQFELQNKLLVFLSNKNNIRCPRPMVTKDQKPFDIVALTSGNHIVRLLEFISGDIMFKLRNPGDDIYYQVGALVAQMDNVLEEEVIIVSNGASNPTSLPSLVLQSFNQSAYSKHKSIQWCLGAASDILDCIQAVDEQKQILIKKVVTEFSSRVLTVEHKLAKGIIHGDINEQNLIIETLNGKPIVKAVIDFGDTHYCCYLYELAIAVTYMIFLSNDLDSGAHVLAGYSSLRYIRGKEFQLLKICVMTRFCQSLVLGAYANLKDPTNDYLLTTAQKGWGLLEKLTQQSEEDILKRWKRLTH